MPTGPGWWAGTQKRALKRGLCPGRAHRSAGERLLRGLRKAGDPCLWLGTVPKPGETGSGSRASTTAPSPRRPRHRPPVRDVGPPGVSFPGRAQAVCPDKGRVRRVPGAPAGGLHQEHHQVAGLAGGDHRGRRGLLPPGPPPPGQGLAHRQPAHQRQHLVRRGPGGQAVGAGWAGSRAVPHRPLLSQPPAVPRRRHLPADPKEVLRPGPARQVRALAHQTPVRASAAWWPRLWDVSVPDTLSHSPAPAGAAPLHPSGFRTRNLHKHLELGAEPGADVTEGVGSASVGCPGPDALQPLPGSGRGGGVQAFKDNTQRPGQARVGGRGGRHRQRAGRPLARPREPLQTAGALGSSCVSLIPQGHGGAAPGHRPRSGRAGSQDVFATGLGGRQEDSPQCRPPPGQSLAG